MSVIEKVVYARTVAGKKIHAIRSLDGGNALTLCGSMIYQLSLVEQPIPARQLCEWCRAQLEKEDG